MNKDDVAGLAERLMSKVFGNLTPGAIDHADLDGMAFLVKDTADALTTLSARAESLHIENAELYDREATALEEARDLRARVETQEASLAVLTPSQRLLADKGMPVGGMDRVKYAMPWHIFDHRQAERNHGGQTLLRLAERGGLDWTEAAAIVQKRAWFAMEMDEAEKIVRQALEGEDGALRDA